MEKVISQENMEQSIEGTAQNTEPYKVEDKGPRNIEYCCTYDDLPTTIEVISKNEGAT